MARGIIDYSSGQARLSERAQKAIANSQALVDELASKPSIIGKLARIRLHQVGGAHGPWLYGNVVDESRSFPGEPRAVRIQRGDPARHGEVVHSWQFEFGGYAEDEED